MRLIASSRNWLTSILVLTIIFASSPAIVFAEEVPVDPGQTSSEPAVQETPSAPSAENTQTPPAEQSPEPPVQGPVEPVGPTAPTYTYNDETGLWENGTYTWDPNTKQTKPVEAPTYSYNPTTGRWDTTEWVYDAPSGAYIENVISVPAPPENATIVDGSPGPQSPTSRSGSLGEDTENNPSSQQAQSSLAPSSSSGPSSHGIFDLFYNASISNKLSSLAQTGDALVAFNTLAGDALSGNAAAFATLFNFMQSSWGLLSGNFTTFTQNLLGDMFGDLFFTPPSSSPNGTATLPDDTKIIISDNAIIENDVTLSANSGDAGVQSNTTAGNATSGSASAVANIINAINSSIAANQSFVGMLNIFGNLNGDILLPDNLISTLLASNMLGTLDTASLSNGSTLAQFNTNQSIQNNINLGAETGDATVGNNTSAGSATSGDGSTNLTVLNLTGRQVIGSNALLVFVNVMGTWVGVIVDAPQGTTAAALGGGITSNETTAIEADTTQTIRNNIDVSAASGDASVENNTTAGNATSGSAHAGVNLLNMTGSQLALSDWFGILFINVFGTWNGSFGLDTMAGELPETPLAATYAQPTGQSLAASDIKAYRFVPGGNGTYSVEPASTSDEEVMAAVSSITDAPTNTSASQQTTSDISRGQSDWMFTLAGVLVASSLLGTERVLSRRQTMTK